jgi:hypothetical protein
MLDDTDNRIRCPAIHALGCNRCKEGACHLDEEKALPRAIALSANDPDPHVRACDTGLVGRWVQSILKLKTRLLEHANWM